MRSDWQQISLGEVTKWSSGGTPSKNNPSYWHGDIPWISAKNMPDGWVENVEPYITRTGLDAGSRLAPINSILMLVRGSGLFNRRYISIVRKPVAFNQDIKCIEASEGVNPLFLYYLLRGYDHQLMGMLETTGIGAGKYDTKRLQEMQIYLPPLSEQHDVAAILSNLDDKVENNTKINHHLEQMAQAIFMSWFVDFEPFADGEFIDSELGEIPAGWSVQTIEYLAEKIAMGPFGSNIKVETFVESGVPIISGNHLRRLYLDELTYNFITEEHARRLSNSLVRAGDIIFTHAGNIGQVALIPDDCDYPYYVISQRQFYLRCDKKKALPEYINYFFHNREGQWKLLANASQTGVPSIARPSSHLKSIKVNLPPIEVQLEWFGTVRAMLQTLNSNNKESKRLVSIRDSLLPRLMSGELSGTDLTAK